MKQLLMVGIHDNFGYAYTVLEQLGISTLIVDNIQEGIDSGIRIFFWNKEDVFLKNKKNSIKIAVITDNRLLGLILGYQTFKRNGFYYKNEKSIFNERSFYIEMPLYVLPFEGQGKCYDKKNEVISNSGILIYEIKNIVFVSLPWQVFDTQMGEKWGYRPYYSKITNKHFVEVGPSIDYGALRRLLFEILIYSFNQLALPLVRLSHFYKNKRHFSVRIDADDFSIASTESVIRIANSINAKFTWFIDVAGWNKNIEYLTKLIENGQEVQLHSFLHMTYASKIVNKLNIKAGIKKLRNYGITVKSIVSPFGFNFKGFSEAIKDLGFYYSSEFGYAVDDLPSYPFNNKRYPLQIPVHPGSVGVFTENFSRKEMFDHLLEAAEKHADMDGIAILYDHPVGRMEKYEKEYTEMLENLIKKGYEYINMSSYYKHWIKRHKNPLIVFNADRRIEIEGDTNCDFEYELYGDCSNAKDLNMTKKEIQKTEDFFSYPPSKVFELIKKCESIYINAANVSVLGWYLRNLLNTAKEKLYMYKQILNFSNR